MSDERYFHLPPDLQVGDVVTAAAPQLWDIDQYNIKAVWEMGITGKGVRVAVDDTGVDENHPDIPKAVARRSFVGGDTGDRNAHGTWCAGRAVGRNGIGVAPEADLIVAKVLSDGGSGSTSGINAARIWAASEGADILSESLGGPQGSQSDVDSIEKAYEGGIQLDVAAAGNAGYNGANTIGYPGRYLQTWCIGSHDQSGRISNFSSGGREIDCATPGSNVISAKPGGGHQSMNGTSMSTPFFAGLMALIIHKRRLAGYPDVHSADHWREFFSIQGFWDDAGEPGKDVRFGLGKPMIEKIIDWLKDPKWFVWFLILFGLPSMAIGQEAFKASVSQVSSFEADAATITDIEGGVSVMVEGMKAGIVPAVIVKTDAVNPLVRAYKSDKPFPPTQLNQIGGGRYLLNGPAGSKWTIEILAQTESGWWTEYLEATIGSGTAPNPPPVDPPPQPDKWSVIQAWIAANPIPGLDVPNANKWAAYLDSAIPRMAGKSLDEAVAIGKQARDQVFVIEHENLRTNWNPFLTELSQKVEANPPTDTLDYVEFVKALSKGLKR